ncbi:MAG: hypothetical protein KAV45_12810 [Calditrichia bacterium]|nr:hypothetical protein [Calditrichia bacterium]
MKNILAKYLLLFLLGTLGFAQEQFTPADIDAVGDRSWRRMGVLNGNLIGTVYFNTGQVSKDKVFPQLEWPVGSGHIYMDTVVPLVAAEARDVNGNLIHPLEVNYEFSNDVSPDGLTEWGWQPLPGYLNFNQSEPAVSHKTQTWPEVWPDHPDWAGFWNGFFGRGIQNADQEAYYVVDDDADEEFLFYPNANDQNRRGLGMRMSVRGLQWSQVLAEDVIFWIFDVRNVGTTDYEKTLFGMFIDSKNGGHDFDNGFYDTKLDITYIWDQTGTGTWGGPTGWIGYGYLESPGISNDGIDNDEDGLTDESRDSGPGQFLFGPVGDYGPDKDHWSGDEDGDWNPETDDVGADGVGPLDEGYFGPDDGEGDGIPTDGEPNFDRTDLDESDQIGLEGVSLHSWGDFPLDDDEKIWNFLANKNRDESQQFSNIGVLYSSGPFPLDAGRIERFSIALLMGADFDDLVRNKEIVQRIFDANYRFAKPPSKPLVKAVAGDGFVTLTWDREAEDSRDAFLGLDPDGLGFKKDFEGYIIYRSTDPGLLDSRIITDAFGNNIFRSPEAQFDLKNGVFGTDKVGLPNGAHFYLGDDTGLAHSWTDTNVINGRTYYYAVVSYDAGDPNLGSGGLPPSQSTSIIEKDLSGNITTDKNTAMVTPKIPSAGYTPPEIENEPDHIQGDGSGEVFVRILLPGDVPASRTYQIAFSDTIVREEGYFLYNTAGYSVWNMDENQLVVENSVYFEPGDIYPIFDGMGVDVNNATTSFLSESSGLRSGQSDFTISAVPDTSSSGATAGLGGIYPFDYYITFFSSIVDTSSGSDLGLSEIPVNFTVRTSADDQLVDFIFLDNDVDQVVTSGDIIIPLIRLDTTLSSSGYGTTWRIGFSGSGTPPQPDDIFDVVFSKPFGFNDIYEFSSIEAAGINQSKARQDLNLVAAVPNPYLVANVLEPKSSTTSGRGERVITFIHLPKKCTIRIFTLRGYLVDTIVHDSIESDGMAKWNITSKDGIDVSYGVYLFHVEAPDVGNKIGRFAIIK